MAQTHPVLRRYYAAIHLADPEAMWRLGCDARRLSIGDAPGQAYRQIHPARHYWSPANTAQGTRHWIEASGIDQQQFTDASHWPMIDRPQETAQAIASFYENL
jgi:pimeloyl-ACP methyl ester carboxylesterase